METVFEAPGEIVKAIWTTMPLIAENHYTNWEQEILRARDCGDHYGLYFVKPGFRARGGGMFTVHVEKETYKILKTYYAR